VPDDVAPSRATEPTTSEPSAGSGRAGSLTRWAWATLICLGVSAAVAIDGVTADLHRAGVIHRVLADPGSVTRAELVQADDRYRFAARLALVMILVTATVFITWQYRTVRRLAPLRPIAFRHGPGWAIGGWFVPVLNLVRPKQMIDDAWLATDLGWEHSDRPPTAFHLWWAAWLLANLVDQIAARWFERSSVTGLLDADRTAAIGDGLTVVAAALAIWSVWLLDTATRASTGAGSGERPVEARFTRSSRFSRNIDLGSHPGRGEPLPPTRSF
jgi:hypothetical protein